jgi:CHAT domain-containing protein
LNAGLITLSACQSGMSRIRAGDESMGLPRAFIYAGSPSIIASLWNVSDKATAQFMKNLYEFLKGKDKVSALRATQLRFLKDPDYRHPYFWSGFTLIGDYL